MARISYLLPLRWTDDRAAADLTGYLRWLAAQPLVAEVLVVDGSPPPVFAAHAARWRPAVRHLAPNPRLGYANGKVNGVLTGVRQARCEHVIIADDDVRYDAAGLAAVDRLLAETDLVRPQNYFDPAPLWARWDTARSLLNRALGADYPGTLGVRRSALEQVGGYDGDVLFENLELIRTMRAYGCREAVATGLFVARRPCTLRRFAGQRLQQAYDDLAQPARLGLFLSVLPAVVASRRHPAVLASAGAAVVALAEAGRRRDGASTIFPATATLLAPGWVLERAVCSWLAVLVRVARGGYRYRDRRITVAAHSVRRLRRSDREVPAGGSPAPAVRRACGSRRRTA